LLTLILETDQVQEKGKKKNSKKKLWGWESYGEEVALRLVTFRKQIKIQEVKVDIKLH